MIGKHARDFRRLISYHEAGHAVVARRLGIEIAGVDMTANNDRFANVRIRTATWAALQAGRDQAALVHGLYTDLMVALAGQVAQKLAGYPEGDFRSDGDLGEGTLDIDNAIDYAWRLARIEAGLPIELGPDEPVTSSPVIRCTPLASPLSSAQRRKLSPCWRTIG